MYLHIAWDAGGRVAGFGGLHEIEEHAAEGGADTASRKFRLVSAGRCTLHDKHVRVDAASELLVLNQLVRETECLGQLITAHGIHDGSDPMYKIF